MARSTRHNVRRSVKTALVVFAVLGLIAGALGYVFNPRNLARYSAMEVRLETVRQMNHAIARDNARLAREIEACRNDPRYLERVARREYRLIADGQTVYLFPDEAPDRQTLDRQAPVPIAVR